MLFKYEYIHPAMKMWIYQIHEPKLWVAKVNVVVLWMCSFFSKKVVLCVEAISIYINILKTIIRVDSDKFWKYNIICHHKYTSIFISPIPTLFLIIPVEPVAKLWVFLMTSQTVNNTERRRYT